MQLDDFKKLIGRNAPDTLARQFINANTVHVLPGQDEYSAFKSSAGQLFPLADPVVVAGSGNWGFSLNPEKLWTPFGEHSDVDVVLISEAMFQETWSEIRSIHRRDWYKLSQDSQDRFLRNGQNIYCGFASPLWIPTIGHPMRYSFISTIGKLSRAIEERTVSAMIFRNEVEAVSYYERGFRIARRRLGL